MLSHWGWEGLGWEGLARQFANHWVGEGGLLSRRKHGKVLTASQFLSCLLFFSFDFSASSLHAEESQFCRLRGLRVKARFSLPHLDRLLCTFAPLLHCFSVVFDLFKPSSWEMHFKSQVLLNPQHHKDLLSRMGPGRSCVTDSPVFVQLLF